MKVKLLGIAFALLLFTGTARAHSYYHGGGGWGYHHYYGHCGGGWGYHHYYGPWGGGWGPGPIYWRPPVSIDIGVAPSEWQPGYYYYPSTPVVVNRTVYASSSVLSRAQARLRNLGYYKGAVDGAFGPATQRAVTMFQSENGLVVTGRLDSQTLQRLKINV